MCRRALPAGDEAQTAREALLAPRGGLAPPVLTSRVAARAAEALHQGSCVPFVNTPHFLQHVVTSLFLKAPRPRELLLIEPTFSSGESSAAEAVTKCHGILSGIYGTRVATTYVLFPSLQSCFLGRTRWSFLGGILGSGMTVYTRRSHLPPLDRWQPGRRNFNSSFPNYF